MQVLVHDLSEISLVMPEAEAAQRVDEGLPRHDGEILVALHQ